MKFSTNLRTLYTRDIKSEISKKILLANSSDKRNTKDIGVGVPADPIFFTNNKLGALTNSRFSADIRYRNNYNQSPLNNIYHRNSLFVFAENNEIKKALKVIQNEICIADTKAKKYSMYPMINLTQIPDDKQNTGKAIQEYLDNVFYPKLMQLLGWKHNSKFKEVISEFLITGKLCYEIVYDNLNKPTEIVNIIPLDPSELYKVKVDDYIYYIQRPMDGTKERILHENQIVLVEYNPNEFGYVSYVEKLKRAFNIMRGMQTAKIMWFAVKSQVRMHIKLNMGDVSRVEAKNRLQEAKNDFINNFDFDADSGELYYNNQPVIESYSQIFTAETVNSGAPEIEEINTQGPDLTEIDSLQYWEKLFWKETEIPYDRIDPSNMDTWSFVDTTALRKTETNFARFIEDIREYLAEILLKPIIIQLTLKEVEIGVDLSLLDSINIEWLGINSYDKLQEMEVLQKKIEMCSSFISFGSQSDASGFERQAIPLEYIMQTYLDFTPEQLKRMKEIQRRTDIELGFLTNDDGNRVSLYSPEYQAIGEKKSQDAFGEEDDNFNDEDMDGEEDEDFNNETED